MICNVCGSTINGACQYCSVCMAIIISDIIIDKFINMGEKTND